MNVLIISYKFPPVLSPRSFRWGSVAEWMARQGDRITVICSRAQGAPMEELRTGIRVLRVGPGIGTVSDWPQDIGSETERARSLFWPWIRACRAAFRWPDYAYEFLTPALHMALRIIEEENPDVLVTVSHPFTPHLVGLQLKRSHKLFWLADIGDPFGIPETPCLNNRFLYRQRNRLAEGSVLSGADAVAVTNAETKRALQRHFPGLTQRVAVVPPLAPQLERTTRLASRRLEYPRLMAAGRFYRRDRSPRPMLEALQALRQIPEMERATLHIYGSTRDCEHLFRAPRLREGVVLHGIVDQGEVLQSYAQADCVINVGNRSGVQLPSKVVELAMLGKPVINFSASRQDSSYQFFSGHPLAVQILTDSSTSPNAAARQIASAIKAAPPTELTARIESFMAPYLMDEIGGAYRRLMSCGC